MGKLNKFVIHNIMHTKYENKKKNGISLSLFPSIPKHEIAGLISLPKFIFF